MGVKSTIVKFFAASSLYFLFALATPPTINIKNGTIQGSVLKSHISGRDIFSFQGIPYALPPIGELRFQAPQPANAWTGVLVTNKDADECVQRDFIDHHKIIGSESCLYLNVYSPKLPSSKVQNENKKYPVMVWIHGGSFTGGSGYSKLYGPGYLLERDVVLVTMNYRLGPMGFLSTEDEVLPGNLGMKDQVQALRWVNENIEAFGGDPESVTIFGESAGGVSVHYHMISPLSKGLFHRAISQSGTVLSSWTLYRPGAAKKHAKRVGELLNCPTDNSVDLITCMRGKNAAEIVALDVDFKVLGMDPAIIYKLSIEPDHPGAFLNEEPTELFKKGKINDVPWLTGVNSHEGSLRVVHLFSSEEKNSIEKLDKEWNKYAPVSLIIDDTCPEKFHNEVTDKIRQFYFGNSDITRSTKEELINLYGDAWFNVGTHDSLKTHLQYFKSPVYFYHFAYRGRYSYSNVFDYFEDYGVNHGDDIPYLFPIGLKFFFELIEPPRSTEDLKVVDVMTNLWYNFAKTGNPTPDDVTEKIPEKWTPVQDEKLEYFEIKNSNDLKMSKNIYTERMAFWDSIPHRGNVVQFVNNVKDEL